LFGETNNAHTVATIISAISSFSSNSLSTPLHQRRRPNNIAPRSGESRGLSLSRQSSGVSSISGNIGNNNGNDANTNTMDTSSQFDVLKRQATKLERNLEDKVARYQQLVQSIPDTSANDLFLAESGLGSPTIASTAEDEAALRHDIQRTLTTLQDLVTTQLQPKAEKIGKSLLVKRYREILFDLSGDFEKSRQAHTRKVERAKLMEGANVQRSSALNIDQDGMGHLMRERSHIDASQSAAANVINQAVEIRNDLRNQGLSLGRAQGLMGQITSNIPGINTIVDAIKKKRSKDDKIVAGVIASLILFTLWYLK